MSKKGKPFRVFYSWQSDSPPITNRFAIAAALKKACAALSGPKVAVEFDEATRGTSGSPNIPQTILDKIQTSDAFVCDVTTINKSSPKGRRNPNPNVVFELGYAVSVLGWGRIVLLFNREYGSFPDDLPFDFDRHRASPYRLRIADKKNKTAHALLLDLTKHAVQEIIRLQPPRPRHGASEESIRRQSDVTNVEWLMSQVSLVSLDEMIEGLPKYQIGRIFYFWECFNAVFRSSTFHIHDKKLKRFIEAFHRDWDGCTSYSDFYRDTSNPEQSRFLRPHEVGSRQTIEKAWKKIERSRASLKKSLEQLLAYLREKYPEIDIKKCSQIAWSEYLRNK